MLAVATAQANARRGLEPRLWEMFAYCARYGQQPISEMRALTLEELSTFVNELSKIVQAENVRTED